MKPPRQLDLFLDIAPATEKRCKLDQTADVVAFPMARHVTVREMAETMTRVPANSRDAFWRQHSRNLFRERQMLGLSRERVRADVHDYTQAVYRLTVFLDADPGRASGRGA